MGLRTVVLKLYQPSKTKQKLIDEALLSYNKAFQFLLNQAKDNLHALDERFRGKNGQYNALALSKWIDKDLSQQLNQYHVQPFKDSLKLEFGTVVANYQRSGNSRSEAVSHKLRPIYFCRYDTKRSYCLLYDKTSDRYYAKLYLLNRTHARVNPNASDCSEKLVHIHQNADVLQRTDRKETYIIAPLAFGQWQEKILKEAIEAPERFKTARLFKKNGEYYLAISIEINRTEPIQTTTFMGVSRGIKNQLNYAVVTKAGEILCSGSVNHGTAYQNTRSIPLNELHAAANEVSDMADFYKAQVIVQNLTQKGDKLSFIKGLEDHYQPRYRLKDYNHFARLLNYKLSWQCLPQPIRVSSIDIFHTCPSCNLNSKGNRLNKDFFICIGCGTVLNIDQLGSINLAKKLIHYHASKIKIKILKVDEGVKFTNKILGLDCLSSHKENQLERLKQEIQKIMSSTRDTAPSYPMKTQTGRKSLIKKLKSAEDFMDLIEYI